MLTGVSIKTRKRQRGWSVLIKAGGYQEVITKMNSGHVKYIFLLLAVTAVLGRTNDTNATSTITIIPFPSSMAIASRVLTTTRIYTSTYHYNSTKVGPLSPSPTATSNASTSLHSASKTTTHAVLPSSTLPITSMPTQKPASTSSHQTVSSSHHVTSKAPTSSSPILSSSVSSSPVSSSPASKVSPTNTGTIPSPSSKSSVPVSSSVHPTGKPGPVIKYHCGPECKSLRKRLWVAGTFAILFAIVAGALGVLFFRQRRIAAESGDPALSRLI